MSTNILKKEIDSLDELEFELDSEEHKLAKPIDPKNPTHYVNNKELYAELCKYHKAKVEALARGEEIPPLTEKIGRAIIQIATRRCNSWNFVGYSDSWKQEMISNAILVATIRGHNFDPAKSKNPFAYFTQLCNNAILEQLKIEKRQLYIKYKQLDMIGGFQASNLEGESNTVYNEDLSSFDPDTDVASSPTTELTYEERMRYIAEYEERTFTKKDKKSSKKAQEPIITLD